MSDTVARCGWAEGSDLERDYHDREWGVPSRDDRHLFELLSLEGAQAGLSWSTILRKRDGYRRAFAEFDAAKVARFTPARIERLVADPAIVRHRGKIESVIDNAKRVLEVAAEFGSFSAYTSAHARSCELEPNTRSTRLPVHICAPVARSLPT